MCEMASLETRALFGGLRTAFWRVWGRLGGWECSQETVLVGLYASSHRGKILPTPIDRYCCISVAPYQSTSSHSSIIDRRNRARSFAPRSRT